MTQLLGRGLSFDCSLYRYTCSFFGRNPENDSFMMKGVINVTWAGPVDFFRFHVSLFGILCEELGRIYVWFAITSC